MIIDEAHCVSHWGADFRKKYGSIGIVRAFLPRRTPIIAVTATLTARVRRDLYSKLHFPKHGNAFHNAGNDRPNVSIVVRAMEHPQNTYTDLDFVLPDVIECAADIPKTYIYADDIKTGSDIVEHLNTLLKRRSPALVERGVIRPYNATLSDDYRQRAMDEFKAGGIRVMVCTDAAGMVRLLRVCSRYVHADKCYDRDVTSQILTSLCNGSCRSVSPSSCSELEGRRGGSGIQVLQSCSLSGRHTRSTFLSCRPTAVRASLLRRVPRGHQSSRSEKPVRRASRR